MILSTNDKVTYKGAPSTPRHLESAEMVRLITRLHCRSLVFTACLLQSWSGRQLSEKCKRNYLRDLDSHLH